MSSYCACVPKPAGPSGPISPLSPLSPLSPFNPCGPVSPLSPFKLASHSASVPLYPPATANSYADLPLLPSAPSLPGKPCGPCAPVAPFSDVSQSASVPTNPFLTATSYADKPSAPTAPPPPEAYSNNPSAFLVTSTIGIAFVPSIASSTTAVTPRPSLSIGDFIRFTTIRKTPPYFYNPSCFLSCAYATLSANVPDLRAFSAASANSCSAVLSACCPPFVAVPIGCVCFFATRNGLFSTSELTTSSTPTTLPSSSIVTADKSASASASSMYAIFALVATLINSLRIRSCCACVRMASSSASSCFFSSSYFFANSSARSFSDNSARRFSSSAFSYSVAFVLISS